MNEISNHRPVRACAVFSRGAAQGGVGGGGRRVHVVFSCNVLSFSLFRSQFYRLPTRNFSRMEGVFSMIHGGFRFHRNEHEHDQY